jgi:hypothetical protein
MRLAVSVQYKGSQPSKCKPRSAEDRSAAARENMKQLPDPCRTITRSYAVSHETKVSLTVATQRLILSEKCCISMGRNVSGYGVMTDGKGKDWGKADLM